MSPSNGCVDVFLNVYEHTFNSGMCYTIPNANDWGCSNLFSSMVLFSPPSADTRIVLFWHFVVCASRKSNKKHIHVQHKSRMHWTNKIYVDRLQHRCLDHCWKCQIKTKFFIAILLWQNILCGSCVHTTHQQRNVANATKEWLSQIGEKSRTKNTHTHK